MHRSNISRPLGLTLRLRRRPVWTKLRTIRDDHSARLAQLSVHSLKFLKRFSEYLFLRNRLATEWARCAPVGVGAHQTRLLFTTAMETFTFDHLPQEFREVHLALFTGIPDGAGGALKSHLIAASQLPDEDPERAAVNFAFIDASMVLSREMALTAAHQALLSASRGPLSESQPYGMRSASVHGEIIFALHPANNIGDALRTFGVGPASKDLLVLRVSPPTTETDRLALQQAMAQAIDTGTNAPKPAPTANLNSALIKGANLSKIAKAYKVNDATTSLRLPDYAVQLEHLVVTAISIKSVAA